MKIVVADKKLEKWLKDPGELKRMLGAQRAELLKVRIKQISIASSLEELRHQPGHFHPLTGDRAGQWACNLDQPYRMIMECRKEGEEYIVIIEIVDYH